MDADGKSSGTSRKAAVGLSLSMLLRCFVSNDQEPDPNQVLVLSRPRVQPEQVPGGT